MFGLIFSITPTTNLAEVIELSIKAVGTLGALLIISRQSDFTYMKELKNEFIDIKLVKQRDKVALFWEKEKITIYNHAKQSRGDNAMVLSNTKLTVEELRHEAEKLIKGKIDINITDEFLKTHDKSIKLTQKILNNFEHLGKLVKAGVIKHDVIELFFYTIIADTFIVCLPYILHRRKTKETYAMNLQRLIEICPNMSGDLCSV